MDNEISAVMTATMSKIKEMVDTNTVVGEPITTPDDITLIPLSRVRLCLCQRRVGVPDEGKQKRCRLR